MYLAVNTRNKAKSVDAVRENSCCILGKSNEINNVPRTKRRFILMLKQIAHVPTMVNYLPSTIPKCRHCELLYWTRRYLCFIYGSENCVLIFKMYETFVLKELVVVYACECWGKIQRVPFITIVSTAAVTGCPGGCRPSMR